MSNDYGYDSLPEHMREGARLYIERHIEPGGFMRSVLENDLVGAYQRADSTNIHRMKDWVMWLYWGCPRDAWGSPEKVTKWLTVEDKPKEGP